MLDRERTLLAAFLAPPLAGIAYWLLYSLTRWSETPEILWSQLVPGASLASLGIYVAMLLAGVPAYLLLRRFKLVSSASVVAVGIAIPGILILLSELWGAYIPESGSAFSYFRENCQEIVDNVRTECGYWLQWRDRILALATGGICGLFFWLIHAGCGPNRQLN